MFIIFDLDDTLLDTSRCLTPLFLKRAYGEMQKIEEIASPLQKLLMLNQKAVSAKVAIKDFCMAEGVSEAAMEAGVVSMGWPIPEEVVIEPVPGAIETLNVLKKKHELAIVTAGSTLLQRQKVEKAGLQPQLFCKIIVADGNSKKSAYKQLLEGRDPKEVLVVGDRVQVDLSPAKELGMTTVHFPHGRGIFHTEPKEDVDWQIDQLEELQRI